MEKESFQKVVYTYIYMLAIRIYRTDTIIFVCTCPYRMVQEKYISTALAWSRESSLFPPNGAIRTTESSLWIHVIHKKRYHIHRGKYYIRVKHYVCKFTYKFPSNVAMISRYDNYCSLCWRLLRNNWIVDRSSIEINLFIKLPLIDRFGS